MIEPLLRNHSSQLQLIYDRMPSHVRSLLTSIRGLVLAQLRYNPGTYKMLRELRSHEQWTSEQIRAYQFHALQQTLQQAQLNVPFYHKYPRVFRSWKEFSSLPVLNRETVRQNATRLVTTAIAKKALIRVGTTGTTGANLKVVYSAQVAQQNWAFWLRQWAWAGIQPRDPRITFYGSRIVPASRLGPPYWTYNLPEHQILMSIFHLSVHTAPDYLEFLRCHKGKVLEGFPSVLGILSDFVLEKQPIPMRVVFTNGEPLYPFLREKIEKAFQTRVYDGYGLTELCGMIQECEHGHMHLIPEFGYLEILDESNRPVEASEEGYLVWTGLVNHTMPLIRYRVGDRGRWQNGGCGCGRMFRLVIPSITRESDLLRSPDGRIFSARAVNQLLKSSSAFRFCQFVQDGSDQVVVRVVASNGNAAPELAQVCADLQKLLGNRMRVSGQLQAEPITRAGGKIPLIVHQINSCGQSGSS